MIKRICERYKHLVQGHGSCIDGSLVGGTSGCESGEVLVCMRILLAITGALQLMVVS